MPTWHTFKAHDSTGHLLVTTAATEYLPTDPTMMSPEKGGKLAAAVIALLAAAVGHPRLPKLAVFVRLESLEQVTARN